MENENKPEASAASEPTSYRVMVHGVGDPKGHLSGNLKRYATKELAIAAAENLQDRWMGMDGYEIHPSNDPVY